MDRDEDGRGRGTLTGKNGKWEGQRKGTGTNTAVGGMRGTSFEYFFIAFVHMVPMSPILPLPRKRHDDVLTIYAPVFYTAPCVKCLMRASALRGVGPGP